MSQARTFPWPHLHEFCARVFRHLGVPEAQAALAADVLSAADRRGIDSHGVARLRTYYDLLNIGRINPRARPRIVRETASTATVDGDNGLGLVVGPWANDVAMDKAAAVGTGWVSVCDTNHYGIAGYYVLKAVERDMIGWSMTNTTRGVAPLWGAERMLGTNPIAVAARAGRFGILCLDMATSTIPRGRIEVAARRGEVLLPGWAIGPEGSAATTPEAALAGSLQPLGGTEETAGYKGYGLALIVEVLTGILAGAAFGPNIIGLFSTEGKSDLGQFFMAIDPGVVDGPASFVNRLEKLIDQLTSAPLIPDAPGPVLYAGQPEAERAARQARNGIVIDREHHESLIGLGERYQLRFPRVRSLTRSRAGGRKTGDLREGKSS